jgi:class 3 adenylate cyclase
VSIHPELAAAIAALDDRGYWASAYDTKWRVVAETNEQTAVLSERFSDGLFPWGPEALDLESATDGTLDVYREGLRYMGRWMLSDLGIDREGLREMLHPALRDVVDALDPCESSVTGWASPSAYLGDMIGQASVAFRVRDSVGVVVGTVLFAKPNVDMNTIAMLTAAGDLDHFQRMHRLARVSRRPSAVLFADLEGSAQLSKRMPTAAYFSLVRRMTRAADRCVIDEGGLVGRHIGDGVAAFFVAETVGSEAIAARACIAAARSLQVAMLQIAERHDLPAEDVTVRAGLHWGSTLHVGSIITLGRTEVTALGDEVNETARIEACATGGRLLSSKSLIERLDPADAKELDIDPDHIQYVQLADLDTATEKARRDAPAIAVCDLTNPSD